MHTRLERKKIKPIVLGQSDVLRLCNSVRELADGQLEATTSDPHICLDLQIPRGYYLARVSIESDSPKTSTKIYFAGITDGGYTEDRSLRLQANPKVTANAWTALYLEEDSHIRFDPVDQKCTFRLNHFSLLPCGENFARKLIQKCLPEIRREDIDKNDEKYDIALFNRYKAIQEEQSQAGGRSQSISYNDWLKQEKYLFDCDKHKIKAHINSLASKPLISIILPVYNTPQNLLVECIDSVLNQAYENWELCISDDNSTDQAVREILDNYTKIDKRIKCVFRGENGHISANSNSALELATGDFYAFLDHDDLLAPHALLYLVTAINKEPSAGIIYSDEDKIDDAGKRLNPHFKPAFNFEMLLSQNYICHLLCIRADIVKSVNGFDIGAEGCQDHILLIKCAIICSQKYLAIVHIPIILYHWRMTMQSTALNAGNKSYTKNNYLASLERVFRDYNIRGVKPLPGIASNTYHISYEIIDPRPMVSIIIPTRNGLDLSRKCYESILKHEAAYPDFEIIIIDNQSDDPKAIKWFREIEHHTKTKVAEYNHEFNYSAINNYAAKLSRGKILVLLNNDTEVISDNWLELLVSHACKQDVGCVGAMLFYDDDTIQHAGAILGIGGVAGHSHKYFERSSFGYHSRLCLTQQVSAVTAACLAVRKEVFTAVGGLDTVNLKVAFNDIDFCLRVQEAGFRNIFEPQVRLYHYESKSRGKEDSAEKKERFQTEVLYMKERWKHILHADRFYNPNLSLEREDFSIRHPSFSINNLNSRSIKLNHGL